MTNFYFPFGLAVAGMLFYHIAQKAIPNGMNPFVATILAYVAGIVVCGICALVIPGNKPVLGSIKHANWAVVGVGVAAACIEIGFMLAYRAGWRISIAAVATNAAATALLVPVGILAFKDHLSFRNILGLVFCVGGLLLVVRD